MISNVNIATLPATTVFVFVCVSFIVELTPFQFDSELVTQLITH